ncbi:hypothetical protein CHS0354_041795 [Potamilus streckersoni]|uniref:Uncharacterized protein n=1 Tax=Potamilus streckersoni TaxID=2493646 RepID=A0AAE0T192_9BIVA|nr:hypothetical protein CHS0354_041795 [Potamilus streckersoni]
MDKITRGVIEMRPRLKRPFFYEICSKEYHQEIIETHPKVNRIVTAAVDASRLNTTHQIVDQLNQIIFDIDINIVAAAAEPSNKHFEPTLAEQEQENIKYDRERIQEEQ